MKRTALLFLSFIFCISFYAGKKAYYILKLTDGTTVKGFIVRKFDDNRFLFENDMKKENYYSIDQVVSIQRDTVYELQDKKDKEWSRKNSKNEVQFEACYATDSRYPNMDTYRVAIVEGYRITPAFYLGIGFGFNIYKLNTVSDTPLFLRSSYTFSKSKFSPYISNDIGYTLPFFIQLIAKGYYINPSVGVRCKLKKMPTVDLSVGYRVQQLNQQYLDVFVDQTRTFNYLCFNLGVKL